MTSNEYLDAVRAKLGITSDYALAKALGVSKTAAHQWKMGICGFNDETAIKVARILEINPCLVVLDMHRQGAKDDRLKAIWQGIFEGFPPLLPHAKTVSGFALLW